MDLNAAEFREIVESLRKTVAILREVDVRYALAGSVASWARGGPETSNDLDLIVAPDDAERAFEALQRAGMAGEVPPEGWLYKLKDGDVEIDLIFKVTGVDDVHEILERAEVMRVASLDVPVSRVEDHLTPKLLAFDEHYLDYTGALRVARALREQVDWPELRERTDHSPYARGFFALLEALDVIPGEDGARPGKTRPADEQAEPRPGPQIRVVQ
jgi:predicted nucleotidyltransferase